MKGDVYLIPVYLSEDNTESFIAGVVKDRIRISSNFLVENVRTSRRFISSLDLGLDISSLSFIQMDKNFDEGILTQLFEKVAAGNPLCILSEAGLPCIADPGHKAVQYAHRENFRVHPMPGASSMTLALVASGFNGQQYTFHGYLPIDQKARESAIRNMEKTVENTGYTQLFMETPYRNHKLMESLVRVCKPSTRIFCGMDISGGKESCQTKTASEWAKSKPDMHKIPAMFGLGSF